MTHDKWWALGGRGYRAGNCEVWQSRYGMILPKAGDELRGLLLAADDNGHDAHVIGNLEQHFIHADDGGVRKGCNECLGFGKRQRAK
jgi:hypothetical protein